MNTTMFSVLLTTAALASSAQNGSFGGMGGSFVYGNYSDYASNCVGNCYPYYYPYQYVPWGNRVDDSKCAALEKQIRDLTLKIKDMERTIESQNGVEEIRRANKELHEKMMAELKNLNNESVERKINETVERRINEIVKRESETKVSSVTSAATSDANNNAMLLAKIVELLEKTTAVRNEPIMADIRDALQTLNIVFVKMGQNVQSTDIKPGFSLTKALIIVTLPGDAHLKVDTFQSTIGSNIRTFVTPDLEKGKSYFYNLHLEVVRNNKTYVAEQKVYFEPGREIHVSFENIETAIANAKKD